MTLKDLKPGESGIISYISVNLTMRLRLFDMGFIPNTLIKIQKIAPLGDPIQLQLRGYEIIIRKEIASKIQITRGTKE